MGWTHIAYIMHTTYPPAAWRESNTSLTPVSRPLDLTNMRFVLKYLAQSLISPEPSMGVCRTTFTKCYPALSTKAFNIVKGQPKKLSPNTEYHELLFNIGHWRKKVNSERGQVREGKKKTSVVSCTKVFYSNVLMITTLILSSGEMKAISQSRVWDKNIASQSVLMRNICNFCDSKRSNMFLKTSAVQLQSQICLLNSFWSEAAVFVLVFK